jgi:GTP diphosphokinase / guanosine-3',5'-bis(diphosphate) 3'-diphosphatase
MVEAEIGTGWPLVMRAAEKASSWHVDERHKDGKAPFINHLIEVATLVTIATAGRDPVLAAAAFLHDAIEKANVEPGQIRDAFGEKVCALVLEVTDAHGLTKEERRQQQVEAAAQKSPKAKMLKLADKTSNLRALARDDADRDNARDYAQWAEAVAKGLRGTDRWLEEQFDQALSLLRRRIGEGAEERKSTWG